MYVVENGQPRQLTNPDNSCKATVESFELSSRDDFPIIGPSCTMAPGDSAIEKSRQRWKWQRWLKWIGIFIVFAVLFYWLCVSDDSWKTKSRKYRFYYRNM